MPLSETPEDDLTPQEVSAQLRSLSAADFKRAGSLAKMCAAGIPGMDAGDLFKKRWSSCCWANVFGAAGYIPW